MKLTKNNIVALLGLTLMLSFSFTSDPIRSIGEPNGNATRDCTDCEFDFTAYGSECCDSAWDEFAIDCATLEANYSWDCSGCLCPGDVPCEDQGLIECEFGAVGGGNCAEDESGCLEQGECPAGQVADCDGSGECWPESWIGDGFGDCEDQAYGADLTCYDNDGGDCADTGGTTGATTGGTTDGGTTGGSEACTDCEFDFTAYGSECCDSAWDDFGIDCATLEANYTWDCSGCNCPGDGDPVCGDGICNGDETYETCPEDCNAPGECADGEVADCDESGECWPESWIGDGFGDCEDQAYGADLTCYDNDGGDCADTGGTTGATTGGTTDGGTTGGSEACTDCEFDFTAYGSECCDSAWDEFGIDCATLEANYSWDCSGCNCPGDIPCEDQGLITCWNGLCAETEDDCLEVGECPDGQVSDCDESGECWPESWIGDGFGDCEDQQYGADLTCYDNDGGDCGETVSCEEQGLVECFDGTCAASEEECAGCPAGTVADCSGDGDCGFETWIGDGYCDGTAQQYGQDNCCYDLDGGDCTEEECAGSREQCDNILKKGTILSMNTKVDYIRSSKVETTPLVLDLSSLRSPLDNKPIVRDGIVLNGSINFVNNINLTTREITANVSFSCDACVQGGPWSGTFAADPNAGLFTLYGLDAGSEVCATMEFCDGAPCSDPVGPLCVNAGDLGSNDCAEDSGCDGAGSGDVNGDGSSDVLDIVQIVNVILGGSFADDCAAEAADLNGDGSADVLDIVQIVNGILGRSDTSDATSAQILLDNNTLSISANGYIGGVQMTLSHGNDFSIDLTDDALVAEYNTSENQTTLVVVVPGSDELFSYSGDFEIVDMIVANSSDRVNTSIVKGFSLSQAYPNPFNPTTSMMLAIPEAGNVSVQVYNIMGQVVATLASGYMDANTYTLTWDASDVSSGMYFVKAESAGTVTTQKLVLMK